MRHPVELSLAVAGVRSALIYHNGSSEKRSFAGEAGRFFDENKQKIIIIKMKSGRSGPPLLMGAHLAAAARPARRHPRAARPMPAGRGIPRTMHSRLNYTINSK
ncbi:hypothetical protein O0L34_g11437 [Tuta absoluta]|nr:hypothetical protein O0L34_g11437 [Tuta absoluta]